ncbi:MAG: hypothetical protein K2G55_18285 [Lachnospiraceae bacterium]|nr:hypothetical protein [Lachnospiraceae bacterium]MDE7205239.1 hypothetical protein [Lachnospiraceae bacterium]
MLKGRYPPPQYKIYGKEITEDYDEPCFFTEILDGGSRAETKNFAKGSFTIKITYFQKVKNELDQLEKVDEIKELFGLFFSVGDRKLTVGDFSHDFTGEHQDILQISVEIDYKENTQKEDTAQIVSEIGVGITQG